jgi:hypothetical protein
VKRFFMRLFAKEPEEDTIPPIDPEQDLTELINNDAVLGKSYTKRQMIELAFEKDWGLIQNVEQNAGEHEQFYLTLSFEVIIPTPVMEVFAREAKKKMCTDLCEDKDA